MQRQSMTGTRMSTFKAMTASPQTLRLQTAEVTATPATTYQQPVKHIMRVSRFKYFKRTSITYTNLTVNHRCFQIF